ncbi:MAG TPA: GNAT family protein [Solirubrobacteraceae bacterium]|nr:GNAT family protein [Solirubrobacteraceae bacterium]
MSVAATATLADVDGYELRRWRERDAEELRTLIERNRGELAKWLSWAQEPNGHDTRAYIARVHDGEHDGRRLQRAIACRGSIVGDVGLFVDRDNATAAIGYWLDREHRGCGVMTAAVRELARHGFAELALRRIEIRTDVLNLASRAVAERLGFQLEGVLRESYRVAADHYSDDAVYSMLASEAGALS